MQQVTVRSMVKAVESAPSLPTPNSEKASCLPDLPSGERQLAILRIIGEVEIAKNLNPPLNIQQRNVLMRLLSDTGLPLSEIAKVGRRVMEATTYNTLGYDHWKAGMDQIRFKMPRTEPDRYCADCEVNHAWNIVCPKLTEEVKP